MGIQVTFSYSGWLARFPEFQQVPQQTVLAYLNDAQIYHRNDGGGPVTDPASQLVLLNLMVAHIVQLNFAFNGQPSSPVVGRVTNASEGSVSFGSELQVPPGTPQWLNQTKYGAEYYAMTSPYRTMRYVRGHPRLFDRFRAGLGL